MLNEVKNKHPHCVGEKLPFPSFSLHNNYPLVSKTKTHSHHKMILLRKKPRKPINQLFTKSLTISTKSTNPSSSSSSPESEIERITKLINNHPFPDHPLQPLLLHSIKPSLLSTHLVENVLGRLFSGHSNGLKAFEFFKFSLHHSQFFQPTSDSFEKTLHILTRMRNFDKGFELMNEIRQKYPTLLTLKSMSIFLTKFAKFQSFEDTLKVFERMEKEIFVDRSFDVDEFNVLLRAFCSERQMKEARSVFGKMYPRFLPNTQTLNILLLGFKESGDITAMELFYHDMIRRGFKPNVITYNVRIDAYCKKGCFGDGLRIFEEMERMNCLPTLETITTLIYGAGIVRNILRARQLFDEIPQRNLLPDTGVYNALMSSFIRTKDVKSAKELMDEMEEKGIEHDNVTYHTMFLGMKKSEGFEGVYNLCKRMIEKRFLPKAYTVVMLMKFFCENRRPDLGLEFWEYLVERGCCPHGHAVDLLVTGLCCQGEVEVAYGCIKQVVERGRYPSEGGFRVMERFLVEAGEIEKLKNLTEMIKRLQTVLALSKGHALGIPSSISL